MRKSLYYFYAKDANVIKIVIRRTNPLCSNRSVISKFFYMGDFHRILRQTCDKYKFIQLFHK